jgi:hypothetical protein
VEPAMLWAFVEKPASGRDRPTIFLSHQF